MGSIVRIQGVCSALSNSRHQLTGIELWAPDLRFVRVDEAAQEDLFARPTRAFGDLRRYDVENSLDRRVRTSGIVILHALGRFLYVQDGPDSLVALSRQQDALEPGDLVEVVGFPGNEGAGLSFVKRYIARWGAHPSRARCLFPLFMRSTPIFRVSWRGRMVSC